MSRAVTVHPTARVRGRVRLPGDKSISHRYALLAALASGTSTIHGFSTGRDCASTLTCLQGLGVTIDVTASDSTGGLRVVVEGRGLGNLAAPEQVLDAGNSGSTMRMLAGILAAHPFSSTLDGDESLRRRPMRRVIAPLERMGARIDSADGRPPITIAGPPSLEPIEFQADVPSAQVKSAVLLAGLHAPGVTTVVEPVATRDHTERALAAFGAPVARSGPRISVAGGRPLQARELRVPGDVSSAVFWMAAAAGLPDSDVTIEHVGLNPTRTAVLDVLRRMGARIDVTLEHDDRGEPMGSIRVRHAGLAAAEIAPEEVPGLIDELPMLAALGAMGAGLQVSGAQELRVKESDRISCVAEGLRRLGAEVDERPDGFHVRGGRRLTGGQADAVSDHRLAMSFAIAALGAAGPSTILDAGAADVSYPEFFSVLDALRA